MVHPSPKLGAGGRIFKHRHLRAGSLRILKLILRPHILVAGVGFEPTYSVLMRQASSSTLPRDNLGGQASELKRRVPTHK